MLLTSAKAAKHLGVSSVTLRRWERQGLIKCRQVPGHHRIYDVGSVGTSPSSTTAVSTDTDQQSTPTSEEKVNYIYARVSSRKQQPDLQRQIDKLRQLFPDHTVVSDIGSGINFKRHGLRALLERSSQGLVGEVVVAHRDRLCRFAFDLLEYIFRLHDTRLHVVHADLPSSEAGVQELSEDILAINTVFICRLQGKRAAENRRRRRLQGQREGETTGQENVVSEEEAENRSTYQEVGGPSLPEWGTESLDETMDGLR
jgi:putative resolvase